MNPETFGRRAEHDLGRCAVVSCPLCMEARIFRLFQADAVWPFVKSGHLMLRCEVCGCTRDVPESERAAALDAVALFRCLEAGELTAAGHAVRLVALGFHTLRTLDEDAASWQCGGCGEKNPGNFAECWNCHAVMPGLESLPEEEAAPTLPNTSRCADPGKPWEGF